ncbi:hypothetical protein Q8W32_09625 [Oceanobacter sp. 3_MG-2023]|nr:hypothetical protein [Oceanobacter sp. 3_MG-2023]MDP2505972.1 hypothetical protein [Oceanobacter sp. 3_MG-2023]
MDIVIQQAQVVTNTQSIFLIFIKQRTFLPGLQRRHGKIGLTDFLTGEHTGY